MNLLMARISRRGYMAAVLLALTLPLLLRADDGDAQERDSRRRQIQAMSAAERDRLERQFQTYRDMSPEHRAELGRMHREIEEDAKRAGNLRDVLQNYHDWLKTLSPWQREELRRASDNQTKLTLIRDFLEHQDNGPSRYRSGRPRSPFYMPGPFADAPTLGNDDLAALTVKLEKSAQLPQPLREELQELDGSRRTLRLLAHQAKGRGGRGEWLDVEEITASISDAEVRARIDEVVDDEERRRFVGAIVVKSLMVQWRAQTERVLPNDDQIQTFYEQLEPKLRDELMQLPSAEFQEEVRARYMREQAPDLARIHEELHAIMRRLWSDHRRPDRFGPRGRFRGPDERHPPGPPGPPIGRDRRGRRPGPPRRGERDR